MSKATPKAGLTLFSREDDKLKFVHSPSASGDVAIKHKLGNKLTLGLGFSDTTVRKIRSVPGLVLSGDLKVNKDVTLSAAHNLANKALKAGITYNTQVGGKKTTFKANYLTKGNALSGEVISALAPNKKASVAFTKDQITNVKLALNDGPFTYEPSYNLVRKAPSLAVSRPLGRGKYKVGWNLRTDDVTLEYTLEGVRFLAHKRPQELAPLIGVSFERDFSF
ncbi:hypothetical protein Rsub_12904 [Raphidocelis subcapitata]|uniref:Uncharacterized protein n=1 Tax=Raphidocelis subcapitata TaxID=307507 RepID=A0A2V0PL33_9CHLO|nr:hypothetical protein Rsub_12904 [Raphidocelis subcapitata]|eukprot:GBG00260.1 hypothetical protein Rsub_12904 [Raphidocelis subcapitata]